MIEGKNYRISRENVAAHELIGLNAVVVGGSDSSRVGLRGRIVDETKNVVVLETKRGLKRIPKREAVFELRLGNEAVRLDGRSVLARPEDRIKLVWRSRGWRAMT